MVGRSSKPSPLEALGPRVLDAIDEGVERRWEPALDRASAATGATLDERVIDVTAAFRRELGLAGAAAGGTSAVPGVGVVTNTAAFALELGWSTVRLADLILTIAALHGHDDASVEERRLWVLSILTFGDGASSMVTRLARQVGKRSATGAPGRIPAETLGGLNRALSRTVVAKYGTRRGVMALGRVIPFGVGALLGYGLNSYVVKATARSAHAFFAELPTTMRTLGG